MKTVKGFSKIVAMVGAVALGLTLSACGNTNSASNTDSKNSGSTPTVWFMLDWTPNTNHIGLYVAQKLGYYKDAGVNVKILPTAQAGAETSVENGVANVGFTTLSNVAAFNSQGADLKFVFDLTQKPVARWCALASRTDIKTPKDLSGKTFVSFGSAEQTAVVRQMIKYAGGTGDIKTATAGTNTFETLTSGKGDFGGFYVTWEGVESELNGPKLNCFVASDWGVPGNPYQLGFAVKGSWLKDSANTDALKKFIAATKKGYDYALANPDKAALYDRLKAGELPEGFDKALDDLEATFEVGKGVATRGASGSVLNAIAAVMPELWGGSADLGGSNKTDLKGAATFAPAECATKQWPVCSPYGRQLHFGVREFTMGTITNGILLGSHTRPFGGTFFMFSDYERSAVRLAALMQIPNLYVWSHDSVAVGEDGPTHQPVEHLASFRAIPQLEVVRPADAYETAEAYRYFFEKKNTLPAAMVLTRQGVPVLAETAEKAKDGVKKGAYVLVDTEGTPDVIIMATGSEVQWAVSAAKTLADEGIKARVVSAPSLEWFEEQDAEYKEAVLPASVKARVSVEAGVAMPWYKYLGSYGKPVSIEQFGLQGDGAQNMIDLGITAEHVVEAAKASIAEVEAAK